MRLVRHILRGIPGRPFVVAFLVAVALLAGHVSSQAPPTETLSFAPVADVFVDASDANANFASDSRLRIDGAPVNTAYLRFTVAGVDGRPVEHARLRLAVVGDSVTGGTIHHISNGSWNPSAVTYNTRPAVDGSAIHTLGAVAIGEVVEFNLDGAITRDGTYNLAIDSTNGDSVSYASMRAVSGQRPALVLTVGSALNPTVRIVQPSDGARFFTGDPVTLQATATDAVDGDLAASLRWRSDRDGELGQGGAISPVLSPGSHAITASVDDRDGFSGSARVSVSIVPPPGPNTEPLVAITAPLDGRTFTRGEPVSLAATANDQEDGDLTGGLAWTSDRDGALGTGGSATVSNLSEGTHHFTASVTDSGSLLGTATVTADVIAPTVLEFTPTADTYVDSGAAVTNFGTAAQLRVDASSIKNSYLRFLVSGVGGRRVTRAILRLKVDTASGSDGDAGGVVRAISSNAWTEATLTYNGRPVLDGAPLATLGPVALGQSVDLDVSAAVTGDRTYNFALTTPSSDAVSYLSRESSTPPRLILHLSGNVPAVSVAAPLTGAVVFAGDWVTLAGAASDVEDGDLSATLAWSSSLDGALGGGPTVTTNALRVGTHTITASVVDAEGLEGQAAVSLRVRGPNAAPTVRIAAPVSGGFAAAGTPVALNASAADDFDADLSAHIVWTSSRDGALGTGASRTVVLSEGQHTLRASVTDSDGAASTAEVGFTVTPTPPVVTIGVPADGAAFAPGAPVVFTGAAIDTTDGDLAAALRWTSDRDGEIGVGASFTATALSLGRHVITASVADAGGLAAEGQRTITVRVANALPTIAIDTPADGMALLAGEPLQLGATASDAENGNLGAAVRWTSSRDGALGTGPVVTVASLSLGSHTITATVSDADGASATASVAVTVGPTMLTFLAVADTYVTSASPTTRFGTASSIQVDASPTIRALLRFTVSGIGPFAVERALLRMTIGSSSGDASNVGGTIHTITDNSWSEATTVYNTRPTIDGPALATRGAVAARAVVDFDVTAGVSAAGTVNFALVTTSSDNALYRSREASTGVPQLVVTLRRNTPPTVTITAPAPGVVVAAGSRVTFAGTATDVQSGDLSAALRWSSNRDGLLGAGPSLSLETLSAGPHVITAEATDPNGASGRASVSVEVDRLPVVHIGAPLDGAAVFLADMPLTLAAAASDAEDGELSGAVRWMSTRDGSLGVGAPLTTSLTAGSHTLTAAVTDASGLTAEARTTIRVREANAAPVLTITGPPAGANIPAGTAVPLAASAADDFDGDLSGRVSWTSSRDGALGTGGSVRAMLREGSHTIRATVSDSDGASSSAEIALVVTATPPEITIAAPPPGVHVFAGTPVTFSGTATDATDGDVSAGLRWVSDRDGLIGTGPAFATGSLSVGAHTVTATATDTGGLATEAARSIVVRGPNVAPAIAIARPRDGTALLVANPLLLVADATDAEDGDLSPDVEWSSSRDGALGRGTPFGVRSLSAGVHQLVATVADHDGATARTSVTVTVAPATLTFAPLADTYVDAADPSAVFGTAAGLFADASPIKEGYLRFILNGLSAFTIERATLRLTAAPSSAAASSVGGIVHLIIDNGWSEATTRYANRPTVDGPALASQGSVSSGAVVDFDVTGGMHGEATYNFALVSTSSNDVIYQSREAATGKPALIVALARNDAPLVTIVAPASGLHVNPGTPIALVATATDAEGGNLSGQIMWGSSADGMLGSGASLSVTTLSEGTHAITARVVDARGAVGEDEVLVHVGRRPVVQITSPASNAIVFTDDLPLALAATASDFEDGDLRDALVWTSSLDGPLGVGPLVSTPLTLGTHVVTATVIDAAGVRGEARTTVRVRTANLPPEVSITAPVPGTSVVGGTPLTLAGVASDDFDGSVSGLIRWTSDRDGLLGSGPVVTATPSQGTHTVTAEVVDSDGASGSARVVLTVTPAPPLVTMTAPAAGTRVFTGSEVVFAASALDAHDGDLSAALGWTSDRDGSMGTGATFASGALSIGTHTITAQVTDSGGLSARAERTVVVRALNEPPLLVIEAPTDGAALVAGRPVLLAARAPDVEDGDLGPGVRWSSDRDGVLGQGALLIVPTLSAGTHALTAVVGDLDGATVTAGVTVTVRPSTLVFTAVADTFVDASKTTTNSGTASSLTADASPVKQVLLRFAVGGIGASTVERVVLRLTAASSSAASSPVGGEVRLITDNAWSEAATTWATRPVVDGPVLATHGAVASNGVADFDLGRGLGADGTYDFALVTTSSDDVLYRSRESSTGKPQLIVTLTHDADPVVHVSGPRSGTVVDVGAPVTFAGTASDAESGDLSARIAWSSDLDGSLGSGAVRTVSTLRPGTHVITARVTDAAGRSAQAQVAVQIGHPPVVAIDAPASGVVIHTRTLPLALRGWAADHEDGDLSAGLRWVSSRDGNLGTGGLIAAGGLTVGTHSITASVTDAHGQVVQAEVTIRVRNDNAGPVLTLIGPPNAGMAPAGIPVTLAASAIDDFDGDLSHGIQWASSRDGDLGSGATLSVLLTEGVHTLTATVTDSDRASTMAEVAFAVTPTPPVVTIASPATGSMPLFRERLAFSATAVDATDGDLSSSLRWTSSRDGLLGTGASIESASLSLGAHTITAAVGDAGGLAGEAQVAITVIRLPAVMILLPAADSGYLATTPVTFYAVAEDILDGDVSASLVWTSDRDGQIGTGRTFTVPALSAGVHAITARATNGDGRIGSAAATVTVHGGVLTFEPVADTYLDAGSPTTRFGTGLELQADGSPVRQALLRFAVTGIGVFPVEDARLELTVANAAGASDFGGVVNSISNNTWPETTATYNTRPPVDGPVRDSRDAPVLDGEVVTFRVTGAVNRDGTYSFALVTPSADVVSYNSREAAAGRPRLTVLLGQPRTPQLPALAIVGPADGTTFLDDEPVALFATATDADDGDLTHAITWRSDRDGLLGVGGTVVTSALSLGVHTVSASVQDRLGAITTRSISLTVVDRPPAVTIIAPADGSLFAVGFPITVAATAFDDRDGDLAPVIVWTSAQDGLLGTGPSITTDALPVGDHLLTARVTNSLGTIGERSITLFVGSAPPRVTILEPIDATMIAEGTSLVLGGSALDLEDGDLSARIVWTSDREGLVGTGAAVPFAPSVIGTHRLRAAVTDSHGFERAAEIAVTVSMAPPAVTIVSPADGTAVFGPLTFVGRAVDFRDGDLSDSITWASSRDGLLGAGATLTAPRLSAGPHVITASRADRDGLTGSARITVAVGNNEPVVVITAPASGTSRVAGQQFTFSATATDVAEGNLSARLRWTSDVNGFIGNGATVSTAALARGTHRITAQATDGAGLTGSAEVEVHVAGSTANQPPAVAITAPATGGSVLRGTPVTFGATAVDDLGGNIAADLVWVSDVDGPIGRGGSFNTATLSSGTHTVTASVSDTGGLTASATVRISVTPAPLTFAAVADAYTDRDAPTTNFGTAATLQGDSSPVRRLYFRFVASGLTGQSIQRAVVRLRTTAATDAGSDAGGSIHALTGAGWDELTITDQNAPAITGPALASAGTLVPSQTVDFDVTAAVAGDGTYDFALQTSSSNVVKYGSREAAAGRPELLVLLVAPPSDRPSVRITAPADHATVPAGEPVTLSATASDTQDGDLSHALVWESSLDGRLATGTSIASVLSDGVHVITARATDTAGESGADLVRVLVSGTAPQVGIVSPADGSTVDFGEPVSFIGTALDPQEGDISFVLTWTSSLDGVLPSGPSFAHMLSPGTHVITARVTDGQGNEGSATATVQVAALDVGFEDMAFGGTVAVGDNEATAEKPESKLWYHDGVWWGTFFSTAANAYRIHRLDFATQRWVDTGTTVDERPKSRQDVLWDGEKLYVASRFDGVPAQCRLYRYGYHPGAQLWSLDTGFPVDVPGGATESLTIAKDSTGTLWLAFTLNDEVWAAHTLGSDATWSTPFVVPVAAGTNVWFDDIAGVVALPGKIGIFWSNQLTDTDYFAVHTDGAPATDPAAWHLEVPATGASVADDHFNMKLASDGRLFVAMKTSKTAVGATIVGLLVRSPSGTWSPVHRVMDITTTPTPTRPQLLLDELARRAYVFYSVAHAAIYYKTSPMDVIAFPAGNGTPFIVKPTSSNVNDATTTKQNVDAATGLVLAASALQERHYYHNGFAPQQRPLVTIVAPAAGAKVSDEASVAFAGSAMSERDGVLTPSLRWTSDRDGQIGVGGAFATSSLSAGTHRITASISDRAGLEGRATIALTVEPDAPPVVTIAEPAAGAGMFVDRPVTFTATAVDSLDGDRADALVWSSDRDGTVGTGASFTRSDLSIGAHVITAQAADASGRTGSASISIELRVPSAPTVALAAPADGRTFLFGRPLSFAATARDAFGNDLSSRLAWRSSRDGAVGIGGTLSRANLTRGVHTITAQVTDASGLTGTAASTITVADEAPPVVTIITPTAGAVLGDVRPIMLTASAVDAIDGDRSATVAWTSSRDGVLGSGPTVTAGPLGPGVHRLTAVATDLAGHTASAEVTIEVRHQPPPAVTIVSPSEGAVLLTEDSVSFAGIASDTVDGDLSAGLRWTSDRDGLLGTGAAFAARLSLGRHVLTASAINRGELSGHAAIGVVMESAPHVVVLAPADTTLVPFGDALSFTGLALDTQDGDLSESLVWTSNRDGLLGTGPTVTVVPSRGLHAITVSSTDSRGYTRTAELTIRVDARPTLTITGPASGSIVGFGEGVPLGAVASDAEEGDLSAAITWSSSLEGPLATGGSILVATLRSGTHVITARVADGVGLGAEGHITVVVNDPPDVVITAPSEGTSVVQGTPVTFSATAADRENGDLAARITWSSDRAGVLGTGPGLTVGTLSPGTHAITASVTDDGGRIDSDTRMLTILGRPSITIDAPLSGTLVDLGDTVPLTARASDFEEGDLSAAIVWTSLVDGALGTGGSLPTATLSAGVHTIVASVVDASGIDAQAEITVVVNAPPVVRILSPTDGAGFQPGTLVLTGAAGDVEDGNLTAAIEWTSSLEGIVGMGGTVATSGLRSGTHVITASVRDSHDLGAIAHVTIVVNATPAVVIIAPADQGVYSPADVVTLRGRAEDLEDGDLSAAIGWTSSLDGSLGTGTPLAVDHLRSGTHTLTATVTDAGGRSAHTRVGVVVNAAPTVTIDTPADHGLVQAGDFVTFTGHAEDLEDGELTAAIAWTSSLDGALGTGTLIGTGSLRAGTHAITAAVTDIGGKRTTAAITLVVNAAPTLAIVAPESGLVLSPGDVVLLTGTASDPEDGNLAAAISWTSSLDGPLGTGTPLPIDRLVSGSHVVTATVTDADGKSASAAITLSVNAAPGVSIVGPPDHVLLQVGDTVTLLASADDHEEGDLTSAISWTSSLAGPLGTGSPLIVPALGAGIHAIAAEVIDAGGKRASAGITVTVNAAPALVITGPPTPAVFSPGDSILLTASADDAEDGSLGAAIVWTTTPGGVLGTGSALPVAGLGSGTYLVTATVADHAGGHAAASLTIVVNAAPAIVLGSPANGAKFSPGQTIALVGTAGDLEDGDLTAAIVWSSNLDGPLGTGSPLSVSSLRSGTHTITATVTDHGGRQASRTRAVVVNAPPTLAITTPADHTLVSPGQPVSFSGTAHDLEDGDLSADIEWSSHLDGVLGTGTILVFDSLSSGTHLITATVTDRGGRIASAPRTLVVNAAPTVAIAPLAGAPFTPGEPVVFHATAGDVEDGDLSAAVGWMSSRDGALGTGGTLITSTLSSGSHVITAVVTDGGGRSSTATVTAVVNGAPALSISAPANGSVFMLGDAVELGGTASDLEDGDLGSAIAWHSNRDGALGGGPTLHTSALSAGTHVLTASVTDAGGRAGTASISLVVDTIPTVVVTAPADQSWLSPAEPVTLTASASDVEEGDLGASIVWSSSLDGPLGTGTALGVSFASAGVRTITATVADHHGGSASAVITVVVSAAPSIAIHTPAEASVFVPGEHVTFTGSASDAEDGSLSAAIAWHSSRDGALGTGAALEVSTLHSGTHVVTAAVTDSAGRTSTATRTVVINAAPSVSISVSFSGGSVRLRGTASDTEDGNLSAAVAWTSDRDGFLGVGSSINGGGLSVGSHLITATVTDSGGKSATAHLTLESE